MIALDASVLVAHLYPDDVHHSEATRLLLEAAPEQLLVHGITMAQVLVGGARIGKGAEMQADLLAAGIRLAASSDEEPLRLAQLRATTGLKLPDCCVLDTALQNSAALATFDRSLATAGNRLEVPVIGLGGRDGHG